MTHRFTETYRAAAIHDPLGAVGSPRGVRSRQERRGTAPRLAGALALAMVAACMSGARHVQAWPAPSAFGGVRGDLDGLCEGGDLHGVPTWPIYSVDLLFSVALDVVLLPLDAALWAVGAGGDEPPDEGPPG